MTAACDDDDRAERVTPDLGVGEDPRLPAVDSPLIAEGDTGTPWSLERRGDIHDACVRALADYVAHLEIDHAGRRLAFRRVVAHHADTSVYESEEPGAVAAVYGDQGEGVYATTTAPRLIPTARSGLVTERAHLESGNPDRPGFLYDVGTYTHDRLLVRAWCDDEVERRAVIMAIEDMANPYRGSGGFRLRLTRYHGAAAKFRLAAQQREGDAADIVSNRWIVAFRFVVIAPAIRVHLGPTVKVRSIGSVT